MNYQPSSINYPTQLSLLRSIVNPNTINMQFLVILSTLAALALATPAPKGVDIAPEAAILMDGLFPHEVAQDTVSERAVDVEKRGPCGGLRYCAGGICHKITCFPTSRTSYCVIFDYPADKC